MEMTTATTDPLTSDQPTTDPLTSDQPTTEMQEWTTTKITATTTEPIDMEIKSDRWTLKKYDTDISGQVITMEVRTPLFYYLRRWLFVSSLVFILAEPRYQVQRWGPYNGENLPKVRYRYCPHEILPWPS